MNNFSLPFNNGSFYVQASNGNSEQTLYNLSFLRLVSRNNTAFVTEMIQIFIEQGDEAFENVQVYYDNKNVESLKYLVHTFKSSSQNIGCIPLANLCKLIEYQLYNTIILFDYIENLWQLVLHFKNLYIATKQAIQKELE